MYFKTFKIKIGAVLFVAPNKVKQAASLSQRLRGSVLAKM